MNNKGFAVSGVLYSLLLIFITILVMLLFNFQNKKNILDQLKSDTISDLNNQNRIIFNEIPSSIVKGESYKIISDSSKNKTIECSSDIDGKVENTNELVTIGTHLITCTATINTGQVITALKEITITENQS